MFVLCYSLLAYLCLQTRDPWSLSTYVWLPAGVTLTVLCITPWQKWYIWLFTSASLHALMSTLVGRPADLTLLFTFADVFTLSSVAFLWRLITQSHSTHAYARMNAIFVLAVLAICSVAASLLYLFVSITYPVTFSHSVTWAISAASGILSLSSCITIGRATSHRGRGPASDNQRRRKMTVCLSLLAMFCYYVLPRIFPSQVMDFTGLLLLLIITLTATLYLNAIQSASYILLCALTISLSSLYQLGPIVNLMGPQNSLLVSQIYLLFLTLLASISFSRISDLRHTQHMMDNLLIFLKEKPAVQDFCRFCYYPQTDRLIWCDPFPESVNLSCPLSMPILKGRFHEENQAELEYFISAKETEKAELLYSHSFEGNILNNDLKYIPASLVLLAIDIRYGNLIYEGILVFH